MTSTTDLQITEDTKYFVAYDPQAVGQLGARLGISILPNNAYSIDLLAQRKLAGKLVVCQVTTYLKATKLRDKWTKLAPTAST